MDLRNRYEHLIGKRFNRLTILFFVTKKVNIEHYKCRCDCGKEKSISIYDIMSGHTTSCGCRASEVKKVIRLTHGDCRKGWTKEFRAWINIKQRCYNKNNAAYQKYGGRGIIVAERWMISFDNFLKDMGRAPSKDHSIERIKNDGNYEPSNCKWATRKEQNNNTRQNLLIRYRGQTKTCAQWCDQLGLNYDKVRQRIKLYNYTPERAFTKP